MTALYKEIIFKIRLSTSDTNHRKAILGKYGEHKTSIFLKKRGYKLLQKNWRNKHGEIDLIAKDRNCLVFIEVRTRNEKALVTGVHTISQHKKQVLKKTAYAYMNLLKQKPDHWRFDVSEVTYHQTSKKIEIQYTESIPF
jgi:putative endonuclease